MPEGSTGHDSFCAECHGHEAIAGQEVRGHAYACSLPSFALRLEALPDGVGLGQGVEFVETFDQAGGRAPGRSPDFWGDSGVLFAF